MIPLQTALEQILQRVPFLGTERVSLFHAAGRILRGRVLAPRDVPPLANAALDGIAFRAADADALATGGNTPIRLRLVGEVAAGAIFSGPVPAGSAVRIMTGAPVPEGTDTVLGVEDLRFEEGCVLVPAGIRPGANVRPAGEDLRAGSEPVLVGSTLTPASLGVLASTGVDRIEVGRRPRVALLATGDELLPIGSSWRPGAIYSSNSVSLAAAVAEAGGEPLDRGIAGDDLDETVRRIESALAEADVVVTTGGVSMGTYDHVRAAAERASVEPVFWRVAIRPGKPVFFGVRGSVPLFGLPGNPASALLTFAELVRPALRAMQGASTVQAPLMEAVLAAPLNQKPGRLGLVRARLSFSSGVVSAIPIDRQGSGVLSSLTQANAVIHVPADVTHLPVGARVYVRPLADLG